MDRSGRVVVPDEPEACSAAKYYFMTHAQCASSVCAKRSATPQRRGYDVTT